MLIEMSKIELALGFFRLVGVTVAITVVATVAIIITEAFLDTVKHSACNL